MTGIVSVIRDVTEMVEAQRRQEQATQKTVEALVRAVELTDPYLAGHSRLMRELAAAVTKALNASKLETATVETAANLSQIGKLFIDRNLLFKTEALTAQRRKRGSSMWCTPAKCCTVSTSACRFTKRHADERVPGRQRLSRRSQGRGHRS